jgi:sialate O-acetylesterase
VTLTLPAGAIYYQGEADAIIGGATASRYQCAFPQMIQSWRDAWHKGTLGEASLTFPFGFVQLSNWGNASNPPVPGEPTAVVRWGQTAGYGYVPNPKLPKVFMATAIDLGAPEGGCGRDTWPGLCIHPGYKQEVGRRLALGARDMILGHTDAYWMGPVFASASVAAPAHGIKVTFRDLGSGGLQVRSPDGFEVSKDGEAWWPATVEHLEKPATVILRSDIPGHLGQNSSYSVRYLWSQNPCTHPHYAIGNCSIYSDGIPAAPFLQPVH